MFTNFKELKDNSKKRMLTKGARIFIASSILFALLYVLSYIVTRLSKYNMYVIAYSRALRSYAESGDPAVFEALAVPEITLPAGLLILAIMVMQSFLNVGFSGYCLTQSRSLSASFIDVFNVFEHTFTVIEMFFRSAIVVLFNSLPGVIIMIAPFFVGDSLPAMLLAYGGLGVIIYWYIRRMLQFSIAVYVMYDNPDFSAKQCLNTAGDLLKDRFMELFRLRFSFVWWYFLDSLMRLYYMPFLSIWLNPYVGLTTANYYNRLCGKYVEIIFAPRDRYPDDEDDPDDDE